MSKQFGLIIPGQQKKAAVKPTQAPTRPSIFDESSNSADSDDDNGAPQKRPSGKPGVVSGPSLMERRVARNLQEKALAEDPTIFQYDELYDEMDNKREEAKETKRQEPRKAKYISRLMEHAERRKLENELRIERQVQKDREAEGEKFKDKDTYVTAAYRKKLETIRQMQEQDKREEYLESIGDVTKQNDLDGFYRHLYEQKLGTQQPVLKPKTAPSTDDIAYKPIKSDVPKSSKQRTYRRRRTSEDDEKMESAEVSGGKDEILKPGVSGNVKAHLTNNIDADSDFSIDDSSDEEPEEKEQEKKQEPKTKPPSKPEVATVQAKATPASDKDSEKPETLKSNDDDDDSDSNSAKESISPAVVKPTIDRTQIWRKRTVGDVFDAALARYQERKLSRRA